MRHLRRGWVALAPTWIALTLVACASGSPSGDPGEGLEQPKCEEGYSVGDDAGACGIPSIAPGDVDAPGGMIAPTIDNSDLDEQRGFYLNQERDGKFFVYTGDTVEVGIRAITNVGQPAPGHTITFEATGNTAGSLLSAARAVTNEFGVAHIQVTGGDRPTHFRIKMTAENTYGLQYHVDVVQRPEGREPGDPNGGGGPGPIGGIQGGCLDPAGIYDITNLYEPGRFLGNGPFEVLDTIHRIVTNPGREAANWIGDRIGGFGGSVVRAAVEPVVNYLFEYVVSNYVPDWGQWILAIVEDITGVLTEMEIQGTMELGQAMGDECNLTGTHRWERLTFFWRAGCPVGDDMCGRYDIDLNSLGIAASESDFEARVTRSLGPVGDLEIGNHQLQMNYGVAIIWFVENVILPQRLNVNSFGELLGIVLPCDAAGDLAAQYLSGVPLLGFAVGPLVEEACESGLEALGNWITGQLTDRLNVDVFNMSGTCKLRDTSGDMIVDKLEEGRWSDGLEGDFTGLRRN